MHFRFALFRDRNDPVGEALECLCTSLHDLQGAVEQKIIKEIFEERLTMIFRDAEFFEFFTVAHREVL